MAFTIYRTRGSVVYDLKFPRHLRAYKKDFVSVKSTVVGRRQLQRTGGGVESQLWNLCNPNPTDFHSLARARFDSPPCRCVSSSAACKKHDDLSYILRITPVDSLGKLGVVMSHYGFYNRNNDGRTCKIRPDGR